MGKKKAPELNIETVNERANMIFLSLLEYRREQYLVIIDNITPTEIGAYVLDFAEQEEIHVSSLLSLATRWFYGRSEKHPFSVDISRMGLTNKVSLIYRTFDASYVSRVVGQGFTYDNTGKAKVKRRRVIPVQEGFPIRFKKTPLSN